MEKSLHPDFVDGGAKVLFLEAINRDPDFLDNPEETEGSVCIAYRHAFGYSYYQLTTSGITAFEIHEPYLKEFKQRVEREFGRPVEMGAV